MIAKFDVDEKVFVVAKVIEINATDEGIIYKLKANTMNGAVLVNIEEDDLRAYTPENTISNNTNNQSNQSSTTDNSNTTNDNNDQQNNEFSNPDDPNDSNTGD